MRRIREILRLCLELGLSQPKIAESMRISSSTVNRLVLRAKAAKLSWPLPDELDDATLEKLLYPPTRGRSQLRPEPDWNHVHEQLKLKGVTLSLLWQEYKEQHPDGFQMSQFFDRYRDWRAKLNISIRQAHRAGQKTFSDFAGAKFQVTDKETGVGTHAYLFVSVLGATDKP